MTPIAEECDLAAVAPLCAHHSGFVFGTHPGEYGGARYGRGELGVVEAIQVGPAQVATALAHASHAAGAFH